MYLIFVLTTALVVLFSIWVPLVKELRALEKLPHVVQGFNKYLLYIVLNITTIIVAPLFFLIWISPKYKEQFYAAILADLKQS